MFEEWSLDLETATIMKRKLQEKKLEVLVMLIKIVK